MISLTKDEARVIGVLVEKALTTPGQYPLTLNSLVSGCNQRSNRLPILNLDENRIITALDSLKAKELAREVMLASSRVTKFRHTAKETLEISISELVVIAELLLRGPQTLGEIRGRLGRLRITRTISPSDFALSAKHCSDPEFTPAASARFGVQG